MATLRELRKRAKALEIDYSKDDTPEELESLIAAKELENEAAEEAAKTEATPEPEPEVKKEAPPKAKKTTKKAPPKKPAGLKDTAEAGGSAVAADIPAIIKGLDIVESNLNQEFIEQAARHGDVVQLVGVSHGKMLTAKSRQKVVEAELYKKHKEKLIESGTAKPTEKMVMAEVFTDPAWVAAENSIAKATEAYTMLKGFQKSYEDRKDMLVQLGAGQRQEKDQIGLTLHDKAKDVVGKKAS